LFVRAWSLRVTKWSPVSVCTGSETDVPGLGRNVESIASAGFYGLQAYAYAYAPDVGCAANSVRWKAETGCQRSCLLTRGTHRAWTSAPARPALHPQSVSACSTRVAMSPTWNLPTAEVETRRRERERAALGPSSASVDDAAD